MIELGYYSDDFYKKFPNHPFCKLLSEYQQSDFEDEAGDYICIEWLNPFADQTVSKYINGLNNIFVSQEGQEALDNILSACEDFDEDDEPIPLTEEPKSAILDRLKYLIQFEINRVSNGIDNPS